ncbi:MAG: glycosyltransferase, partial [Acidimicrobiales bacterium]
MEPQPSAPPVVAVVVTCDPGPWFEETLFSLSDQDYPNLSVLVIDSASAEDPTGRVAAVLPEAFVRRLDQRVGFGRAANEVLRVVEGASHYLFCHDDVAFSSDAVRVMVEEAYRSNAGIVAPKLVEWEQPDRLVAVGASADRVGVMHPLVERGERDQEQHDAVRDVFVAPSGATLVRSDLFATLKGFSAEVDQFGEDLDLCWRAQVAGARVVVTPGARVRHRECLRRGERSGWRGPLAQRRIEALTDSHRVRTLVSCYGFFRLCWVLPMAVFFSLGEALTRLLQGRPGEALAVARSGARGLSRPGRLWSTRRATQRHRSVHDREIHRLQAKGNARLRSFVRARMDAAGNSGLAAVADSDGSRPAADGNVVAALRRRLPPPTVALPRVGGGTWRLPLAVAIVLLVVVAVGSRGLLGPALPAIAQLPSTAGGVGSWWHDWWSTWRPQGLGHVGAGPPGLALMALAGTLLGGAVGTLQHLVVLGPLVVGPLGAYRAARSWGSLRGRVAALVIYAVVPLPYDALARGHWPALLAYAAAPWLLGLIGRVSSEPPFPSVRFGRVVGRVVAAGILTALVGSFAPGFVLVVVVVGVALLAGSILAGRPSSGLRALAVTGVAAGVALVLLAPWGLDAFGSRVTAFGVSAGSAGRLGIGDVLRFHTGPVGAEPLAWALLAPAALPLLIGRSWRLAWAARLWLVALVCFAWVWAGLRGWVPVPDPDVVLAPAAAALAASAALGAVAFDLDLPGYRFGWRQLLSGVALVAAVVAAVPLVIGAGSGRWHLPSGDANSVLAFMPGSKGGDYRVLWVGAPDAIPLASRPLETGFGYATSHNGEAVLADQWLTPRAGSTGLLALDLRRATDGLTTGLGHLLGPLGVRYIVVPSANGPAGTGATPYPVPTDVLRGLQLQTDLQLYDVDPNYTVYQNAAWIPIRAVVPPALAALAA